MESDDGSSPGGVPADPVVERRVMHGHHGDGVHPLVEQVGKDRALGLHVVPGRRYVGDLDAELSDVEGGLSQTPCQSKSKKAAGSWGAMTTILTFHPVDRIKWART